MPFLAITEPAKLHCRHRLRGAAGAHQLINQDGTPARFLAISNYGFPDVVVWPDSGKLGVFELLPGGPGLRAIFRRDDASMYLEAEGREPS